MNALLDSAAGGPLVAARRLREHPGFVFLDSALAGGGAISMLAAEPDMVLAGGADDWWRLDSELARRRRRTPDLGVPSGAAIGWIEFGGAFCFGFYEEAGVFLHGESRWCSAPPAGTDGGPREVLLPRFRPVWECSDYAQAVRRAQDYIAAGDIYQVCLAHPFRAGFTGDLFGFYEALREVSPAPHAAFLDLNGRQVASASPECFLRMSDREIVTRPIKGTRPRRRDPDHDVLQAFELLTSPKEVAELVMITDLERNDLGRLCAYGSISVPELLRLERYEQVHHLVSTVRGTLRADVTHPTALRACSPGGSISGAPKKRALEIIAELEPWPRGLYTGAIGYFGFNGESGFSIAIRTVVAEGGRAEFFAGAGIVADSAPEREWQETLDKASGILAAAGVPLPLPSRTH